MFDRLKPERQEESVYSIDFSKEYEAGIRGLILDIDNTLVPQDAPADERAAGLIRCLQDMGFKVCLISNNDIDRVGAFAEDTGTEFFVEKAKKPSRKAYFRALEKLSLNRENTLYIGDQLFTDIWGANRAGLRCILVRPIDLSSDIPAVRMKRMLEKLFIRWD